MAVVGRVLLIPRGSWNSTDVYNRLDWVRYNGVAWVCKQDNTTGVVPSTSASEWQILAQDGTVGGWSSIASKPFSTIGSGLMVNASDELMVAKNLVTDKTTVQALNELLTGTGTAGYDAGAGASPRYFPAKYIYNTMLTVVDGDMVTIKIPVAGSEYGVYVSLDNGSTYHPVALRETTKFSTEYGVGAYITLIYDALGAVSDIYPVSGGDIPGTVTGGAFKVLNYALSSSSYDVDDPAETDIADDDYVPFYDTSATAKKKSLWSNIKAKLKAYFDGIYTLLTIVGTVESGTTASKAYAVGEHFIRDGAFCTAIAAIAQGAAFTLNTNYTVGTIAEAIPFPKPISITPISGLTIDNNGCYAVGRMIFVSVRFTAKSDISSSTVLFNLPAPVGTMGSTSGIIALAHQNPSTNIQPFINQSGGVRLGASFSSGVTDFISGAYIAK